MCLDHVTVKCQNNDWETAHNNRVSRAMADRNRHIQIASFIISLQAQKQTHTNCQFYNIITGTETDTYKLPVL